MRTTSTTTPHKISNSVCQQTSFYYICLIIQTITEKLNILVNIKISTKVNILRVGQLQHGNKRFFPLQILHNWFLKKKSYQILLIALVTTRITWRTLQYKVTRGESVLRQNENMPMWALQNWVYTSPDTLVLPLVSSQERYKMNLNNFQNLLHSNVGRGLQCARAQLSICPLKKLCSRLITAIVFLITKQQVKS